MDPYRSFRRHVNQPDKSVSRELWRWLNFDENYSYLHLKHYEAPGQKK